ncbi:hypothetical protein [Demetria terragena]|uniref:hypothetical protein n=1 Tax=Demetria terragena TaxID=63959 RepID=UPI00037D1B7B|nr:hypothetical protein [Demetria terragena]
MALTEDNKNQFVDAYTKVLLTSWSSDEYSQRLDSDPRAALAEAGLVLPADAKVTITRGSAEPATTEDAKQSRLDNQVALYETGLETGVFEFHLPSTPQIDTSELEDAELEGAAGGTCCCCCPCCCC